jgi:hypothetical protein
MGRTDLKVPSIFLIFLSKNNPFRLNTDTSNSRNQVDLMANKKTFYIIIALQLEMTGFIQKTFQDVFTKTV